MRTSANLVAAIAMLTAVAGGALGAGRIGGPDTHPAFGGPWPSPPPPVYSYPPGFGYAYPPYSFPYNAPGRGIRAPKYGLGPVDQLPANRERLEQRMRAATRGREQMRRRQIRALRDTLYNYYFGAHAQPWY